MWGQGICLPLCLIPRQAKAVPPDVIVERSIDPNRLNAYLPVDTANRLRVFAANSAVSTQLAAGP